MKFQDLRVGMRVTATGPIDYNKQVVGLVGEITDISKYVVFIRWEKEIKNRDGMFTRQWNAAVITGDLDNLQPVKYQSIDKSEFQDIKVL